MPSPGFEPTTLTNELLQTHAFESAARPLVSAIWAVTIADLVKIRKKKIGHAQNHAYTKNNLSFCVVGHNYTNKPWHRINQTLHFSGTGRRLRVDSSTTWTGTGAQPSLRAPWKKNFAESTRTRSLSQFGCSEEVCLSLHSFSWQKSFYGAGTLKFLNRCKQMHFSGALF